MIYKYLFGRHHIDLPDPKEERYNPFFGRDRSMGANILFASKACLAEAKPALLQQAIFTLRVPSKPWKDAEYQGFSLRDLPMIRTLMVPSIPGRGIDRWPVHLSDYLGGLTQIRIDYQDQAEACLSDSRMWFYKWRLSGKDLPVAPIRSAFKDLGHAALLEHVRRAAAGPRAAEARFEIRFILRCADQRVMIYAELLTQTIWAPDGGRAIAMQMRHEPNLLRNLGVPTTVAATPLEIEV
ncbi:hypothetical protein LTR10_014507 [Elasticomyces elasticus]|uniref:RES domain-containing protein n=1 Tax=Exophiala sideris TaxID=1016849 RepID=A0ABR0JTX5_9EURO|nr:hypothetical protein LTR10_014507 [Elasticomyces elasticus]KAK5040486.1 hypothetical protein LTS07_000984 [Exophiala sideris]KAK5068864.1 hypothetical protein LTR69_000985 [Exophiala sideris]KAK5186460.1 hypothetical protein LTR44_001516 [Eurotiomycetes sp. CCFEE 6388]